jgi:hypothetical protein
VVTEDRQRRLSVKTSNHQLNAILRCLRDTILKYEEAASESTARSICVISAEVRALRQDSEFEERLDNLEKLLNGDKSGTDETAD